MNIVVIKLITFKNNNNDGCKFTNIINNFLTKTLFIMLPNTVIMRNLSPPAFLISMTLN
jgi:hypothetical protein